MGGIKLALINDGWIEPFPEGDLYARDAWGGVYSQKIFMSALKKLRHRPVQTVLV